MTLPSAPPFFTKPLAQSKAPLSSLHIRPQILLLKGKRCGGKEWQNSEEL